MEFPNSSISLNTFTSDAFLADAWGPLLVGSEQPSAAAVAPDASSAPAEAVEAADPWTEQFSRTLQAQHARVREFLQVQRDRWRQIEAHFTRQIEALQAEVYALRAANEGLRAELSDQRDPATAEEASNRPSPDNALDPKDRGAGLQRPSPEGPSELLSGGAAMSSESGADWAALKRRLLAEWESDDQHDGRSPERRLKIEEIVARTDKIIDEKNREIEELRHLLNNQSSSLGSLAVGAAALEQAFDQDAIIREERQRLQQLQDECRAKLRQGEIELSMERARLARRDAEIEEKLRNSELRRIAADGEADALAPTGRPVRGRWRTQLGLTDDRPPEPDRGPERR